MNEQGGHELLDLTTGAVITRGGKITEVPIKDMVVKRVEELAEKQGFKSLKFFNRKKQEILFHDADLLAGVTEEYT